MKDLSEKIGLPVELNEENRLELGDGVEFDGESIRKMSDLTVVTADNSLKLEDKPAYFMYRNVHRAGDEQKLSDNNQRFDLTVIPAARLGDEFIKTSGHYHPEKPGTGVEYPELYYVISGQATYLMQKHEADGSISDVIISRVKAGEAIIMPLNYGHVTINELDETLVMANWVESSFKSEYGDFETKKGAAYFLNSDQSVVKNPRYENVPEAKTMQTNPEAIADLRNVPIYDYINSIEEIDLIAKPEDHLEEFEIGKLFN
jgi:glucose-6-phosphate isomerase